jgi:CheY-like chemotaxis protein
MQEHRHRCLTVGCNDYASKPIDQHELIRLIARHVAKRRGRSE